MLFKDEAEIRVKESSITTIISPDVVIEGSLSSAESIRFNGKITGDLSSNGLIIIGKNASVKGNIKADSVIVAGVVAGNLNIGDKVNIEATGEVYGDIVTKKLLIDEESVFSGQVTMLRDEKTSRRAEAAIKKAEEAAKKANERAGNKEPSEQKETKPAEEGPSEKEGNQAAEEQTADDDIDFISLDAPKSRKKGRNKRR